MVKPTSGGPPPQKIRGGLSKGVAYMRRAMAETKAINKEYRNPTAKNWTYGEFKQTSVDILPSKFVQERIGNVPEEEVVDVPIRRNRYSPEEKYKNLVHRFSYWGFSKDDFKRMPNGDLVEKKYGFLWRPIAYKSPTGDSYHWGLRCCRYDSEGNLIPTNKQYEYIYFNRDDPANKDLFSDPDERPPKPVGDLELEANPPLKITNEFEGEETRLRGYVAKSKGSWQDEKDKPFFWYNQTKVVKPGRKATEDDKDAIDKAQNYMERMIVSKEKAIETATALLDKWTDFVENAEPNPRKALGLKEYNGIRASLQYAREQRDDAQRSIEQSKKDIESYKDAIEKNKKLLANLAPPPEIPGGVEQLPEAPPRFQLAEMEEEAKVARQAPPQPPKRLFKKKPKAEAEAPAEAPVPKSEIESFLENEAEQRQIADKDATKKNVPILPKGYTAILQLFYNAYYNQFFKRFISSQEYFFWKDKLDAVKIGVKPNEDKKKAQQRIDKTMNELNEIWLELRKVPSEKLGPGAPYSNYKTIEVNGITGIDNIIGNSPHSKFMPYTQTNLKNVYEAIENFLDKISDESQFLEQTSNGLAQRYLLFQLIESSLGPGGRMPRPARVIEEIIKNPDKYLSNGAFPSFMPNIPDLAVKLLLPFTGIFNEVYKKKQIPQSEIEKVFARFNEFCIMKPQPGFNYDRLSEIKQFGFYKKGLSKKQQDEYKDIVERTSESLESIEAENLKRPGPLSNIRL